MSMLETHKRALSNLAQIRFHEFKSTYKKGSNNIYFFCEGNDDPSFYRGPIESHLTDNWSVHHWIAGGVDNVLAIYKKIDWRIFNKSQVIFFIDRDLTEFTGARLPQKTNIYITDDYSIENNVVNSNSCERILSEILGFKYLTLKEKEEIRKLFNTGLTNFIESLVPVMSWIVHWRRNHYKACLNNIQMNQIFSLESGLLVKKNIYKDNTNITKYIHSQCGLTIDTNYDLVSGCREFRDNDGHRRFTRGKYLLWFLSEFCLSIHCNCEQMPVLQSIVKRPKNLANFSHSNSIVLISSRYRLPKSLKSFLTMTVQAYIEQKSR